MLRRARSVSLLQRVSVHISLLEMSRVDSEIGR